MDHVSFCPYRQSIIQTGTWTAVQVTEHSAPLTFKPELQVQKLTAPATFTSTAKDLELLESCREDVLKKAPAGETAQYLDPEQFNREGGVDEDTSENRGDETFIPEDIHHEDKHDTRESETMVENCGGPKIPNESDMSDVNKAPGPVIGEASIPPAVPEPPEPSQKIDNTPSLEAQPAGEREDAPSPPIRPKTPSIKPALSDGSSRPHSPASVHFAEGTAPPAPESPLQDSTPKPKDKKAKKADSKKEKALREKAAKEKAAEEKAAREKIAKEEATQRKAAKDEADKLVREEIAKKKAAKAEAARAKAAKAESEKGSDSVKSEPVAENIEKVEKSEKQEKSSKGGKKDKKKDKGKTKEKGGKGKAAAAGASAVVAGAAAAVSIPETTDAPQSEETSPTTEVSETSEVPQEESVPAPVAPEISQAEGVSSVTKISVTPQEEASVPIPETLAPQAEQSTQDPEASSALQAGESSPDSEAQSEPVSSPSSEGEQTPSSGVSTEVASKAPAVESEVILDAGQPSQDPESIETSDKVPEPELAVSGGLTNGATHEAEHATEESDPNQASNEEEHHPSPGNGENPESAESSEGATGPTVAEVNLEQDQVLENSDSADSTETSQEQPESMPVSSENSFQPEPQSDDLNKDHVESAGTESDALNETPALSNAEPLAESAPIEQSKCIANESESITEELSCPNPESPAESPEPKPSPVESSEPVNETESAESEPSAEIVEADLIAEEQLANEDAATSEPAAKLESAPEEQQPSGGVENPDSEPVVETSETPAPTTTPEETSQEATEAAAVIEPEPTLEIQDLNSEPVVETSDGASEESVSIAPEAVVEAQKSEDKENHAKSIVDSGEVSLVEDELVLDVEESEPASELQNPVVGANEESSEDAPAEEECCDASEQSPEFGDLDEEDQIAGLCEKDLDTDVLVDFESTSDRVDAESSSEIQEATEGSSDVLTEDPVTEGIVVAAADSETSPDLDIAQEETTDTSGDPINELPAESTPGKILDLQTPVDPDESCQKPMGETCENMSESAPIGELTSLLDEQVSVEESITEPDQSDGKTETEPERASTEEQSIAEPKQAILPVAETQESPDLISEEPTQPETSEYQEETNEDSDKLEDVDNSVPEVDSSSSNEEGALASEESPPIVGSPEESDDFVVSSELVAEGMSDESLDPDKNVSEHEAASDENDYNQSSEEDTPDLNDRNFSSEQTNVDEAVVVPVVSEDTARVNSVESEAEIIVLPEEHSMLPKSEDMILNVDATEGESSFIEELIEAGNSSHAPDSDGPSQADSNSEEQQVREDDILKNSTADASPEIESTTAEVSKFEIIESVEPKQDEAPNSVGGLITGDSSMSTTSDSTAPTEIPQIEDSDTGDQISGPTDSSDDATLETTPATQESHSSDEPDQQSIDESISKDIEVEPAVPEITLEEVSTPYIEVAIPEALEFQPAEVEIQNDASINGGQLETETSSPEQEQPLQVENVAEPSVDMANSTKLEEVEPEEMETVLEPVSAPPSEEFRSTEPAVDDGIPEVLEEAPSSPDTSGAVLETELPSNTQEALSEEPVFEKSQDTHSNTEEADIEPGNVNERLLTLGFSEVLVEPISGQVPETVEMVPQTESALEPEMQAFEPENLVESSPAVEEIQDEESKEIENNTPAAEESINAPAVEASVDDIVPESAAIKELDAVAETQLNVEVKDSQDSTPVAEMAIAAVATGVAAALLFGEVIPGNNVAPTGVIEKAIVDEPEQMEEPGPLKPPSPKSSEKRSSRHRSSRRSSHQSSSKEIPEEESHRSHSHRKRRDSEISVKEGPLKELKALFFSPPPSKKPSRHDSGVSGISASSTSSHSKKQRTPDEQAAHDKRKEERRAAKAKEAENTPVPDAAVSSEPKPISTHRHSHSRSSHSKDDSDKRQKVRDVKKSESVVKSTSPFMAKDEPQVKEVLKEVKVPTTPQEEKLPLEEEVKAERPKLVDVKRESRRHSHSHSHSHRKESDRERHKVEEEKESRRFRKEKDRHTETAKMEVAEESRRQREKDDEHRRIRREERRKRREAEELEAESAEVKETQVIVETRERDSGSVRSKDREAGSLRERDPERPRTVHRKSSTRERQREREMEKENQKPKKSLWSFLKKEFA